MGRIVFSIDEHSGTDVNHDGVVDLIRREYSGGAHCCTTVRLYSVTDAEARPYFSLKTGNCGVELRDLDGDGILELVTCYDAFAYQYWPYAASALPPVVYRYDPDRRTYSPDTPRYVAAFRAQLNRDLDYAREELAKPEDIATKPMFASFIAQLLIRFTSRGNSPADLSCFVAYYPTAMKNLNRT